MLHLFKSKSWQSLVFSTLFCLSLSTFRCFVAQSGMFLFLIWNLFLAFVPLFISSFLEEKQMNLSKFQVFISILIWILFLPNAPYILTDLVHLNGSLAMPFWFDLILVSSYALLGLSAFYLSIFQMQKIVYQKFELKINLLHLTLFFFLIGFGLYLGRYLRFNSWDLITDPMSLVYTIADRFYQPLQHPRTWGVTLLSGAFLNIIYLNIKHIKS